MKRPNVIALLLTLLIAVAAVLLMVFTHLSLDPVVREWPPQRDTEVALVEDNFFEVTPVPRSLRGAYEEASPALNETPADNLSTPQPTTGHDVRDAGPAGDAPSTVTTPQPAPVQQTVTPEPPVTGPSEQELQAQAEARRRATSATSQAFNRSQGDNNTSNNGKNPGDSGNPAGTAGSFHGHGNGKVNGGWVVPTYNRIPSSVTGSIVVRATVERDGHVSEASVTGGSAPASTDPALRAAVVEEVKRRKFTRTDNNAPAQATAYITYTFK